MPVVFCLFFLFFPLGERLFCLDAGGSQFPAALHQCSLSSVYFRSQSGDLCSLFLRFSFLELFNIAKPCFEVFQMFLIGVQIYGSIFLVE